MPAEPRKKTLQDEKTKNTERKKGTAEKSREKRACRIRRKQKSDKAGNS